MGPALPEGLTALLLTPHHQQHFLPSAPVTVFPEGRDHDGDRHNVVLPGA